MFTGYTFCFIIHELPAIPQVDFTCPKELSRCFLRRICSFFRLFRFCDVVLQTAGKGYLVFNKLPFPASIPRENDCGAIYVPKAPFEHHPNKTSYRVGQHNQEDTSNNFKMSDIGNHTWKKYFNYFT